jgi:hypothetical protein
MWVSYLYQIPKIGKQQQHNNIWLRNYHNACNTHHKRLPSLVIS